MTARRNVVGSMVGRVVASVIVCGVATSAHAQAVTWTNLVNTSVAGTVLQKTGGCDGCGDAGATSQQELTTGDGYVEFTAGEAGTFWMAGLSHGNDDTSYGDIDFAFRFDGAGHADIVENGVYQPGGDTPYGAGDIFRVAIVNGRVRYSRNGISLTESARLPQYPLLLDTALGSVGATVRDAVLAVSAPPPPGGGILEKSGSPALRPRLTRAQIDAFLPPAGAKGPFTFPSPYNTSAVRLTDASDCAGGDDCLWYAGYSYWRNINNHAGRPEMYVFLGTDVARGGSGPILIRYDKLTDAVDNRGPLFPAASPYRNSTAEGWYFSGTRPTALYAFLIGSSQLRRYDVLTKAFDAVPALDVSRCPRPTVCPAEAAYIFQPHSSDDDRVHSATVQNASWQRLGCVVYREAAQKFIFFRTPAGYVLDECHVDKSGKWLLLIETRTTNGVRVNRIAEIRRPRKITTITDVNGALGHLDMGYGYAVGADTYHPLPNATILLKFPVASVLRPVGPVVHYNKRWDLAAANHLAHGNASGAAPAEAQYACGSNASRVADMADEIVCFPLNAARNPDGSLDVLVVGPVLTDLDAAGGRDVDGDDYEQTPKGNLDVTGRYFIWTTNLGGDRLDALLVKIPAERLQPK